jgi:hypothetical protein
MGLKMGIENFYAQCKRCAQYRVLQIKLQHFVRNLLQFQSKK